ncbi:hypothetical protein K474DRAFT_1333136 [Panus rudis PR-1116 ss-1]|nr:hypothetical protein K474DRAFT_1333136 [Panus rudis PR-1116 ss-1]
MFLGRARAHLRGTHGGNEEKTRRAVKQCGCPGGLTSFGRRTLDVEGHDQPTNRSYTAFTYTALTYTAFTQRPNPTWPHPKPQLERTHPTPTYKPKSHSSPTPETDLPKTPSSPTQTPFSPSSPSLHPHSHSHEKPSDPFRLSMRLRIS